MVNCYKAASVSFAALKRAHHVFRPQSCANAGLTHRTIAKDDTTTCHVWHVLTE